MTLLGVLVLPSTNKKLMLHFCGPVSSCQMDIGSWGAVYNPPKVSLASTVKVV